MRLKTNYNNQKSWWRHMDNIVLNYRHKGSSFEWKFLHMTGNKCRLDRMGNICKCWIGILHRNKY